MILQEEDKTEWWLLNLQIFHKWKACKIFDPNPTYLIVTKQPEKGRLLNESYYVKSFLQSVVVKFYHI